MSNIISKCLKCGYETEYSPKENSCKECGFEWRFAHYKLSEIKNGYIEKIKNRPFNLWRYHELLPGDKLLPEISLGEGGTPLIPANNLGMMLGLKNLYFKDERQNPSTSFKDRQAAITITTLKEAGINEVVVASTGNVALSYSAYSARASIKLWAFITSLVNEIKMQETALYGTEVIKVTGNYDQTKKVAAQFAKERGLYVDNGVRSIPTVEGMKTLSYEISEQLGDIFQSKDSPWKSPDWYIQSVSGGLGPIGVIKGFEELVEMGFVNKVPKIANIQVSGCAPMVDAWKEGKRIATPVDNPKTRIATLATGDPGYTYTLLCEMMERNHGGTFEKVTDEEAFRAMHILAKMEGISVEPATAVAFAGLINLVRNGTIKSDEVVVINCTGHTIPVQQYILGDNWVQNVKLEEPKQNTNRNVPEDGLLSALESVNPGKFKNILIVDDTPMAIRLISRILQAQGTYNIFEATNGKEALEVVSKNNIDLILLDLMMPEIDGFGVIDSLKSNEKTSSIPVIVITAKELTKAEKNRFSNKIDVLQKGNFLNDEFLEEIKRILDN